MKPSTKRALGLGSLLLATACGPAAVPAPTGPLPVLTDVSMISAGEGSNHLVLGLSAGRSVDVLVGDHSVTGPGVTITRYHDASDHAIRGDAFGKILNVDITPSGVKGLYGPGPMNLEAKLEGQDLHVTGTVAGKITDFRMNPTGVSGAVGHCMFQMSRQGAGYVGTRGCRSGSEPANLSFPASFKTWSLPELSAALVVLLSSGA